ncbi:hypothetical protein BCR34DRAFT_483656 [Clohesyomyces aquaticus]|uniref:AA1-like domain-containing protein n=1 Tax=Clohesyomyces aquaticus TaxID=1231657 RepID=A0A1Y1ZNJ4_9PLEO|nr:hypothetical protein BCR34DRAFT_483656 [Clohesyomyces aquaticus]
MQLTLAILSLPLLLTQAAPAHPALSLTTRQTDPCAPSSYTITNYQYISSPSGARIYFNFHSHFPNPSIITDASMTAGATCDTNASNGVIPNENECSTGRNNFFFDLAGPPKDANFQLIHTWMCNGKQWMSSTHHKMDNIFCSTGDDGAIQCNAPTNGFAPENARPICSTPTHC